VFEKDMEMLEWGGYIQGVMAIAEVVYWHLFFWNNSAFPGRSIGEQFQSGCNYMSTVPDNLRLAKQFTIDP
jgi:hypothetical protein